MGSNMAQRFEAQMSQTAMIESLRDSKGFDVMRKTYGKNQEMTSTSYGSQRCHTNNNVQNADTAGQITNLVSAQHMTKYVVSVVR